MTLIHQLDRRVLGCRSDGDLAELTGDIEVIGASAVSGSLKADRTLDGERRRALISEVRGGKHVELALSALTFRQKDGVANRRKLRFKSDTLADVASSFAGMPVLRDHNTYEQSARIGTITSSELVAHGGTGWSTFRQALHIVKPEAVISVLDGTLDRFSIGWVPTGPVLCSVHRTDVRGASSCSCWPGDRVEVDGTAQIVEYEFQSAEGTEVSAVNVPAVKGTKIEDIRAALAAELNLQTKKDHHMNFTRLAALLGLAVFASSADEDRAIRAIEDGRREKLAAEQERDAQSARATKAEQERDAALSIARSSTAALAEGKVSTLLAGAYREGKLIHGRDAEGKALASPFEALLRKQAKDEGVGALEATISLMPATAPIGQRVLGADDTRGKDQGPVNVPASVLADVAAQLGIDPKDLERNYEQMTKEG